MENVFVLSLDKPYKIVNVYVQLVKLFQITNVNQFHAQLILKKKPMDHVLQEQLLLNSQVVVVQLDIFQIKMVKHVSN
jgi:hypothetical protein